jgi:hypothetical protein
MPHLRSQRRPDLRQDKFDKIRQAAFGINYKKKTTSETAPGRVEHRPLGGPYSRCSASSTTTLPPLSAVMTLCTGAYPLSVMSIT